MERTKPAQNKNIIEFLSFEAFKSDGFLMVNKTLIRVLGLIPAILLGNYIDKFIYFKERNPDNGSWFYLTHDQQSEQLNIGESVIRKNKQILIVSGILEVKMRGIPAKEWLRINIDALITVLMKAGEGKPSDFRRAISNISKDILSIKETMGSPHTIPPEIEWVKKYCNERNNSIDPNDFVDFYTSKNWMIGKNKMKDWQAAVRTWERNRKGNDSPNKTLKCPHNWPFGSCNPSKQGCMDCEDTNSWLFNRCKRYNR